MSRNDTIVSCHIKREYDSRLNDLAQELGLRYRSEPIKATEWVCEIRGDDAQCQQFQQQIHQLGALYSK